MSNIAALDDFPQNGPPERRELDVDMSFQDVPYLIVPALTQKPIVHVAVECDGVDWNWGSSIRVYVRTKCGGSGVYADRRCVSWSAVCKRCFPRARGETP